MMRVRTINSLMKYLRDNKNIKIAGTADKRNLKNIGYYHGYKGYRYIGNPSNKVNFTRFNELVSIVDFDMKLKGLLYPQIMQIENISKNYVLQVLVETYSTDNFNDIYDKGMIDYRNYQSAKDYKNKIQQRLNVQNNIYLSLSKGYGNNNKIVCHFYSTDRPVPIWGIFEIITLGIFADLIRSLEYSTRAKIREEFKIAKFYDTNAKFPEKIIYMIKSLRNSIAHNDAIFDIRFGDMKPSNDFCLFLEKETNCSNINFNTIVDYVILIVFLLKNFGISKAELNKFITEYNKIVENFRNNIPISIYNQIIYTNNKSKINTLKQYIKS